MLGLGAPELILIILAILLLFGYKKLPDASRSLGRSLRIFKGEMKGMKEDDAVDGLRTRDAAQTTPVRGEIVGPDAPPVPAEPTAEQLAEEARQAELRAAELRARAERARTADGPR
jgi:sec-independent protein translocase protein TatA